MNLSSLRAGMLAAAIAFGHTAAYSATILSSPPDQAFGTNMSFAVVADDFTLGAAYTVTSLRFWSLQEVAADYSGSVYWAIHDNAGGPGSVLHSGTTALVANSTGNSSAFGYAEYEFNIPVSFQLAAGTYWLALQNDFLGNDVSTEMLWGSTSVAGGDNSVYEDFQLVPSVGWTLDGINHAFAILGDRVLPPNPTPEPGSLAMVLGGLIGLRFVRRHRQPA